MNKIDGFSKLHNIQFEQKGIRVWRSYEIGRGKEIPFDQLVSQGQESTCLVITSNFFALKDTRVYKCKEPLAESSDDDHDSELDIFECSEPGCVKSFQTFSELESHLDIGDQIKPRPGSSRFSESLTLVSRQDTRQTLRRFLTICARQQEMNKTIGCLQEEWLTKSHVQAFFSRLAATRRTQQGSAEIDFNARDLLLEDEEFERQRLIVAILKQILCHFEIPFKSRDRKKDLIQQLMYLMEECTCFSS